MTGQYRMVWFAHEARGHPPRHVRHGGRAEQRQLLRARHGPADRQEDDQPDRHDDVPHLLRRREGQLRQQPLVLRVPRPPRRAQRRRQLPPPRLAGRLAGRARLLGAPRGRGGPEQRAPRPLADLLRPRGPAARARGRRRAGRAAGRRGTGHPGRVRAAGLRRGARVRGRRGRQPAVPAGEAELRRDGRPALRGARRAARRLVRLRPAAGGEAQVRRRDRPARRLGLPPRRHRGLAPGRHRRGPGADRGHRPPLLPLGLLHRAGRRPVRDRGAGRPRVHRRRARRRAHGRRPAAAAVARGAAQALRVLADAGADDGRAALARPRPRVSEPLAAARALAPDAAAAAAEGERARRLPAPLVAALAEAGLFRLCVPAAVGGVEAPAATLVECVEALAGGDAAAGGCVAIGATSGLLAAYLPEETARRLYARDTAIAGGVFAPRGRALAVDGGFRVTGRWPFASGCEHCDWLMGGCVVDRGDGELETLDNGMPDVRLMLAPAAEFEIHDTWHVAGLRATGSHDIELRDAFVPSDMAASVISDAPRHDGPLYAFPLFGLLAIAIAGVSLGIARGALDDFAQLAAKVPTGGRRSLGQRGAVQAEIAHAEASVRAARALLLGAIGDAWGGVDGERRAALRLAATHAAAECVRATETAYRLGGGSAIYESSPLQRRLRDAQTITQHMLVAPATWELAGRLLLGQPTDTTQL